MFSGSFKTIQGTHYVPFFYTFDRDYQPYESLFTDQFQQSRESKRKNSNFQQNFVDHTQQINSPTDRKPQRIFATNQYTKRTAIGDLVTVTTYEHRPGYRYRDAAGMKIAENENLTKALPAPCCFMKKGKIREKINRR